MIEVLIADDHASVREGIRLIIDAQPDMRVVGETNDGGGAIEAVMALRPTVVVLDISMPVMNGLAAAQMLTSTAIVTFTRHADDAFVQEMLAAGVRGYVLKQSASSELLTAIRAAASGERYVDASLAERAAKPWRRHLRLTGREREVLRLVAMGRSHKDIASDLSISARTVEVHKARASEKLALNDRRDLLKFATLQGWIAEE